MSTTIVSVLIWRYSDHLFHVATWLFSIWELFFIASGTLMYCLGVRTGQRAGGESPTSSKACNVITLRAAVPTFERCSRSEGEVSKKI